MSFCAIVFAPVSNSRSDTAYLLSQNIAESMCIKKAIEAPAILRSWLQIIQRRLDRQVADYPGQTPGKIRGFLVGRQFSSDRGAAAQLQHWNTMKICIQVVEGTEKGKQLGGGLLADPGHSRNVVHAVAGQRQKIGDQLGDSPEARPDVVVVITRIAAVIPKYVAHADQLRQILIARHQHIAEARGARARGERADDVV